MLNARKRRSVRAERDASSLGNILVDLGYCSRDDINIIVNNPARSITSLLGERLVRADIITREQLEHALMRQRVLRGQEDPGALKRYGTEGRRRAFGEIALRLRDVADSAGLLAQKLKG
jgi:hypothetical protein